MAGSWLPDDLRRKIEEEKYRNRNQDLHLMDGFKIY